MKEVFYFIIKKRRRRKELKKGKTIASQKKEV
jgi:hypothetical protein